MISGKQTLGKQLWRFVRNNLPNMTIVTSNRYKYSRDKWVQLTRDGLIQNGTKPRGKLFSPQDSWRNFLYGFIDTYFNLHPERPIIWILHDDYHVIGWIYDTKNNALIIKGTVQNITRPPAMLFDTSATWIYVLLCGILCSCIVISCSLLCASICIRCLEAKDTKKWARTAGARAKQVARTKTCERCPHARSRSQCVTCIGLKESPKNTGLWKKALPKKGWSKCRKKDKTTL